jgi:hypothetical protein
MHKITKIYKDILNDLFIYIIIVASSNLSDMNDLERLTQMHINNISVYSSFISFVHSFQLTKSSKYTKIF